MSHFQKSATFVTQISCFHYFANKISGKRENDRKMKKSEGPRIILNLLDITLKIYYCLIKSKTQFPSFNPPDTVKLVLSVVEVSDILNTTLSLRKSLFLSPF